jgi:myosin-5
MLSVSENSILKRLFTDSPYFGSQASDSDSLLQEENDFIINLLLLNIDGGEFGKVPSSDNLSGLGSTPNSPSRRSVDIDGGRARSMTRQRSGGFVVAEKILTKFKNQLGSLMDMVNATDVQYVRCVKPNPNKSSVEYDRKMVVDQLRSAGMIEAVRISRAAFPNRLFYRDFLSRFHVLKSKSWHATARQRLSNLSYDKQEKGITEELLVALFPDNKKVSDGTGTTTHYAFGHTKVYFSSEVLQKL